jgi:hypothetical protein
LTVQSIVTLRAHRDDQLARDRAEGVVSEHLDGAVVHLQRLVERRLVGREVQGLAAAVGGAQLLGDLDQLLDDLRRLYRAVLVRTDRALEQVRERTGPCTKCRRDRDP